MAVWRNRTTTIEVKTTIKLEKIYIYKVNSLGVESIYS